MTILEFQELINLSFQELKNEKLIYQFKEKYKSNNNNNLLDEITYEIENNYYDVGTSIDVTNDLFDKNYIISFEVKLDLSSKLLTKIGTDYFKFHSHFEEQLPQNMSIKILERFINKYIDIDEKLAKQYENYYLNFIKYYQYSHLSDNDINLFFNLIENIKIKNSKNLIPNEKINDALDGFLDNNLKNFNNYKKVNFLMLKLDNFEYKKYFNKYKKILNYNENIDIFIEKNITYDSIILNKQSLMSKYKIHTNYGIAGALEYKKIFEMIFSFMKNKKNKNIFNIENILISKISDKSNNIEIIIIPLTNYSSLHKNLIKNYIKSSLEIYSKENLNSLSPNFYDIKKNIKEHLNNLALNELLLLTTDNKKSHTCINKI